MLEEDEPRELVVPDVVRELTGQPPNNENERRMRREIANSNERRRMQSINAGFQSLRTLLPHHEGEKLSKAAILQQTAEYIYTLEQEKTRLLSQNSQLKRLLSLSQQRLEGVAGGGDVDATSPRLKKKRFVESTTRLDDDIVMPYPTTGSADLNVQLIQEQRLRLRLEERLKTLEHHVGGPAVTPIAAPAATPNPPPAVTMLPTQPLKMDIVKEEHTIAHRGAVLAAPTKAANAPCPGSSPAVGLHQAATLLLTDNEGAHVKVEAVSPTRPPPRAAPADPQKPQQPQQQQQKQQPQQPPQQPQQQLQQSKSTDELIEKATNEASTEAASRSYLVTRQNLDHIVEAIRHLEGDHLFSEDDSRHQVANEEVVEYIASSRPQPAAQIVPSKVVAVATKADLAPSSSLKVLNKAIPQTLLPQQPHPPSVVLQQKDPSNSIIIVKHCQT